jgi:hypothetical protein
MVSIFRGYVAVCLYSRSSLRTVVTLSRNPKTLTGVLVDPLGIKPALRIRVVRCNKMKSFLIDAIGMPQRTHMASLKKIEGLNLIGVRLTGIE